MCGISKSSTNSQVDHRKQAEAVLAWEEEGRRARAKKDARSTGTRKETEG